MSTFLAPRPTKRALSPARVQLVELMQTINFGRIEHLRVVAGEPAFDRPPRITRMLKLGGGVNGPRPERLKGDFLLKRSIADLFEQMDQLHTGSIELIEILGGLPTKLIVLGLPNSL